MSTAGAPWTLVVPLSTALPWAGGRNYVESLLATLATLGPGQRPRVELCGRRGGEGEFAGQLLAAGLADTAVLSKPPLGGMPGRLHAALGGLLRHRFGRRERRVVFPVIGRADEPGVRIDWITDFQHRHLPELFSRSELRQRQRSFGRIAARPGIVVLSSRAALADFRAAFPGARATPRVWSFCSSIDLARADAEAPAAKMAAGLPEKYLYVPNQFWRHKNHATAFAALLRLRAGGLRVPLVCTGAESDYRYPGHVAELKRYCADNGLADQIIMLGVVPRPQQVGILRGAAAVLQPSRFEGWSTVLEDAKAFGRTVIASDLEVHREQMAGFSDTRFFPTLDADALAATIADNWDGLRPGPDPEREAAALAALRRRRHELGVSFIDIASEAIAAGSGPGAGATRSTGRNG